MFCCNLDESVPNRARGVKAMVDMLGKLASSERERDEAFWLEPFRIIRIFVSFASSVRRAIPWSAEDGLMSRSRVLGAGPSRPTPSISAVAAGFSRSASRQPSGKGSGKGFSTSELRTTSPPPSRDEQDGRNREDLPDPGVHRSSRTTIPKKWMCS